MLMASTSACYKLFRQKQKEGHGEAVMFKGRLQEGENQGPSFQLWDLAEKEEASTGCTRSGIRFSRWKMEDNVKVILHLNE